MDEERILYNVYVQTNTDGYIAAVNSSAFLNDTTGWIEIDSGYGVKYGHAQSAYFQKSIIVDGTAYRYKMVGGMVIECSAEEIAEQEAKIKSGSESTLEERVGTLEEDRDEMKEALEMILSGVTE